MTTPSPSKDLRQHAEELDFLYTGMDADARLRHAFSVFGGGLIATTSFGRDAALLLHHLHRLEIPIRVFFMDTGFHFPETLQYRDTLTSAFNLNLQTVSSQDPTRRKYAQEENGELRISNTDACCGINKVEVQRRFLALPDVQAVVTGLRRDQGPSRAGTPIVQLQRERIKIAPFVDWPQDDVDLYLRLWETPEHPLAAQGYTSIGCRPVTCTRKPQPGDSARSGRWAGEAKTECGIHLDQ